MDIVGLTGSSIQCNVEEGTCDDIQNAPMWRGPYPKPEEVQSGIRSTRTVERNPMRGGSAAGFVKSQK